MKKSKSTAGIWVVYLMMVVRTALLIIIMMLLNSACTISALPLMPGTGDTDMNMMVVVAEAEAARSSRKLLLLQEEEEEEEKAGGVEVVEDYRPIDPVPSSKASVKPGPIEHGTPLNPFIPRSPPPSSTPPPSPF